MTRDEFIEAALKFSDRLSQLIDKYADEGNPIRTNAMDEWESMTEQMGNPDELTISVFADMAETWNHADELDEQTIIDMVNGKQVQNRVQTLLQERLKTAEGKSNRESFIGDYTDVSEVNAEDPNSVPEFETITYNDLMGTKFDELWQPVEGLITEGLTVLAGGSKIGKSWICMDMAFRAATGTPFWGHNTTGCNVLYLALEDSPRRLQNRIVTLEYDGKDVPNLTFLTSCRTMDDGFEQQISSWLNSHGGRCLVIVDVLQKIRGIARRKDGDAYQADYRNIGNIKKIADRFHAAFVVVHHTKKGRSEDVYDNISGSTGIMSVADTTIMITRDRKEKTATVDVTGRDVYGETFTICADDNMHWNVVDTTFADIVNYNYDPVMLTIKAILKENPDGLTISYNDFRKFGMTEMGYDPAKDGKDLRTKLLRLKDEASIRDGITINLPDKLKKATMFYKCHGEDVRRSKEYADTCVELSRLQVPASDAEQLKLEET